MKYNVISTLTIAYMCFVRVEAHYRDLTYQLDINHMSVPSPYNNSFYKYNLNMSQAGPFGDFPWIAFGKLSTAEHIGTHLDAPYHFYKDGKTVEKFSLEELNGPLVRIDISNRAKSNPSELVQIGDIQAWEEKYGKIPENAMVVMYSGWGQQWGTQKYAEHSPGYSVEAIKWMLKRQPSIRGFSVDTLNCDASNNAGYDAHYAILGAGKICGENLAHLDNVPDHGAKLFLMPIPTTGGSGAPSRAFAVWGSDFSLIGGANGIMMNLKLMAWMVAFSVIYAYI